MRNIFVSIHQFTLRRTFFFYLSLAVLVGGIVVLASQLKVKEDIRAIIPQDIRIDKINMVLNNSNISDRIILTISNKDPAVISPDQLIAASANLVDKLRSHPAYIKSIQFKIKQGAIREIYDFIYTNLPFYLTENDYKEIEKQLSRAELNRTLESAFKLLVSPTGLMLKKQIFMDPLNFTPRVLKRLNKFRLDKNLILHNSIVFTSDKKNLLLFIEPVFSSSQTAENKKLIALLDRSIAKFQVENSGLDISYYGGTAIAVANADRIKSDIILTMSLAMIFLWAFFYFFFQEIEVLLLLFLPVVLGGGFSLALLFLLEGEISAIALGVGAVLLGISVDYSLHIFIHFRSHQSVSGTLKQISEPILMSSLTTASAFLCLFIVRSEALRQLGMFAAFSVAASAFFVLTILPFFLTQQRIPPRNTHKRLSFLDKVSMFRFERNKPLLFIVLAFSILFGFTASDVEFNSDIASLNYLSPRLKRAEQKLKAISSETLSAVYLVTTGKTFDEALGKTERAINQLYERKKQFSFSSAIDLMLSVEKQKQKIEQWNNFWDRIGRDQLKSKFIEIGKKYHFKAKAFNQFYNYLNKEFVPIKSSGFDPVKKIFLKNYLYQSTQQKVVISMFKVNTENKAYLFSKADDEEGIFVFDRQFYTNQFFKVLGEDFNKLVILSMSLVLLILLVFYSRIELTIVAIIPILLSWLWTLGLMGLLGIKFNIFNVIISTFIIGLGIDYSIFIMRGLLNDHKYGNCSLAPYKLSILLSSITTIAGMGVLIFAEHPALRSIALISIFGIFSVVLISYTVLPLLFSVLVNSKGKKRQEPITLRTFITSITALLIFVVGTIFLVVVIPLLSVLPLPRKRVKYLYNTLVMGVCRFVVYTNITVKKKYVNKKILDFESPCILISNHQSFLDLVLILLLHPKIIALTNEWVWKNPFIGFIVQFADYFPIFKGIETGFEQIQKKVEQGYSVLVFPEGSRSVDGTIKRFHQGAFKLADELGLDLQPVLIHGASHCAPKNEFLLRRGHITIKFFDRIKVEKIDFEKGITHNRQAKVVTRFYRSEYKKLSKEKEVPDYFLQKLVNQYIYKGPILEWSIRTKLRLEQNFKLFNEIIPDKCVITDIGCGYGSLAYMLHRVSQERKLLGLDYDRDKIHVARNIAVNHQDLNFLYADIVGYDLPESDVFILIDVLRYFPGHLQIELLQQCMEKLSEKGKIILRDIDLGQEGRTNIPRRTKFPVPNFFQFNKTRYDLSFISGRRIEDLAKASGFEFKRVDNANLTSKVTYILTPKAEPV